MLPRTYPPSLSGISYLAHLLSFVLRTETVLWPLVSFLLWQFKSAHSDLSKFLATSNMKFVTSCEISQGGNGCSCHWYTKDSPSVYYETLKKVFPSDSFADYYFIYLCRSLCLSLFFPSGLFFKLALPNILEVSRSYGVFPEVFRTLQGIDLN